MKPIDTSEGTLMRAAQFTVSKYCAVFSTLRIVRVPERIADLAAVRRAVRVRAGGHVDEHGRHLRMQARGAQALLAAHARAHDDQCLAVPVGPAREIVDRADVREVHIEEVVLVAVARLDGVVALELGRQRVVVLLGLVGHHVVRLDVHGEPAFGGAVRDPGLLQWIGRAGPLQEHEAGIFLLAGGIVRLRDLAPDVFAVEVIHLQDGESRRRPCSLGFSVSTGFIGHLAQCLDLRRPERVEIRGRRNRRRDLLGRDGGAQRAAASRRACSR